MLHFSTGATEEESNTQEVSEECDCFRTEMILCKVKVDEGLLKQETEQRSEKNPNGSGGKDRTTTVTVLRRNM